MKNMRTKWAKKRNKMESAPRNDVAMKEGEQVAGVEQVAEVQVAVAEE